MLHLAVPVIDQHELTRQLLDSVAATAADLDALHLVIVDNGSERPYRKRELGRQPYQISVRSIGTNRGYYQPILEAAGWSTAADLVGLIHNDVVVFERGWDRRLREEFVKDGRLGMVGFCGSNEIDERGGRGGGTMCHFRGEKGQSQDAGRRITDLQPALILDSLFMCMRKPVVDCLGVDEHTPLCHFVDKLWPLRAVRAGWKVAVLGVEIDHLGGMTAVASNRYPKDAAQWCLREGVDPGEDGGLALYLEAERRFLSEARATGMLPARV